jgi:hypothetical protein
METDRARLGDLDRERRRSLDRRSFLTGDFALRSGDFERDRVLRRVAEVDRDRARTGDRFRRLAITPLYTLLLLY